MRSYCLVMAMGILTAGSPVLSATTLVAIWSPAKLVIGADSAVITNVPNAIGSGCKISQDNSSVYAFSGLVQDESAGYNVQALAHQAVQHSNDLSTQLNYFVGLARDPLAKAVAAVKRDSPDQYEYLRQNHPVLQAIFAGVAPGPPALGVAGFSLAADGSLVNFARVVAPGDDRTGTGIIYAGQQSHVKEYLRNHRDWAAGDQAILVRNLIQSEEDASPGEVGGPIDIISIQPNGASWVQKKPECK